MNQNGIIIIDKPADWTSHDVVAKLRGALRGAARDGTIRDGALRGGAAQQKPGAIKNIRVGHGGTLDPIATGVLPVFIGRATRAAEFCVSAEKEYIAGLMPGIVTDTQDITGNVLSEAEAAVTPKDLSAILQRFTGAQKQIPPMYSAVKQDGKKLYELARRGKEVSRDARDIFISSLELIENAGTDSMFPPLYAGTDPAFPPGDPGGTAPNPAFPPGDPGGTAPNPAFLHGDPGGTAANPAFLPSRPVYTLRIVCSKGTYIRTLCHDIGAALGCGATMSALRRLRAGAFTIDIAHTLDDVLSAVLTDSVSDVILPIDSIFSQLPSITLTDADARKAKNGALRRAQDAPDGKYRFYAPDGEFLLLGEVKNNGINTIKNFFTASSRV